LPPDISGTLTNNRVFLQKFICHLSSKTRQVTW
jgi:hypothetical protein